MVSKPEENYTEDNKNLSKYEQLLKQAKEESRTQVDEYIKAVFGINDNTTKTQRIEIIIKDLNEHGYAITLIEERIDKYLENQGVRY